MDFNNYSYTPHMLDEQSTIIASIRNDDMTAPIKRELRRVIKTLHKEDMPA